MNNEPENTFKTPAKVLASLRPGYLTVYFGYGQGLADGGIPQEVPFEKIPVDLCMPNSQFMAIIDRASGSLVGVERHVGQE